MSENTSLILDDRKKQMYGNLFFLLQTEPTLIAGLTKTLQLSEIDSLLQTVMFALYGNQYDSREEYLLLTMFSIVLSATIESATELGSLLRQNTAISRMLTTYIRRGPGQTYLKYVLSEKIRKLIVEKDIDLEINPLKVYEKMVNEIERQTGISSVLATTITSEEAAIDPNVISIIRPRIETLIEICQSFLNTITTSIDKIPYGIRWICKQIKLMTKKKFPKASDDDICSLIGGFFFLRYINPAIVTPQAYMLIETNPSVNPKRTLTLVSISMFLDVTDLNDIRLPRQFRTWRISRATTKNSTCKKSVSSWRETRAASPDFCLICAK